MAMFDDLSFIIPHIRNSFITSDDTGMCEVIIESDDLPSKTASEDVRRQISMHSRHYRDTSPIDSDTDSDTQLSRSVDIIPDMDFGGHRRRSNTAQRLDKLRKDRQQQIKVRNIRWKDSESDGVYDPAEQGYLFEKKIITKSDNSNVSSLTEQLDSFASGPKNPFSEYAKHDGAANAGVPTKSIDIFLTMVSPRDRPFPMRVTCVSNQKVSVKDFLGLTCWMYHNQGREPKLMPDINSYALHIAEDDGEVDHDFPALDISEPITKFGFTKLALVAHKNQSSKRHTSPIVTINLPHRGFSKLQVDDPTTSLRDILDKILKKRKLKQNKGLEYMLELQNKPGKPVDLDAALNSMGDDLEFCLVREHSVRGGEEPEEETVGVSGMAASLSSHQYKSYLVTMANKFRGITEIQLGISGEKIEIDPVSQKGAAKLFKQRAVTHDCDDIASCEFTDEKRGMFKVIYQGESGHHDLKHHDFQADVPVAMEIVEKINNILEMRPSALRKDFIAMRKKKEKK